MATLGSPMRAFANLSSSQIVFKLVLWVSYLQIPREHLLSFCFGSNEVQSSSCFCVSTSTITNSPWGMIWQSNFRNLVLPQCPSNDHSLDMESSPKVYVCIRVRSTGKPNTFTGYKKITKPHSSKKANLCLLFRGLCPREVQGTFTMRGL